MGSVLLKMSQAFKLIDQRSEKADNTFWEIQLYGPYRARDETRETTLLDNHEFVLSKFFPQLTQ